MVASSVVTKALFQVITYIQWIWKLKVEDIQDYHLLHRKIYHYMDAKRTWINPMTPLAR